MFDCCLINTELDLLELRLNILDDVIEKFVIVESNLTHTGLPKPTLFADNYLRFEKFLPKIIYLRYLGLPKEKMTRGEVDVWFNENNQRNILLESLKIARPTDGLLCVCDVDEIPRPEALLQAKELALKHDTAVALNMEFCMYYLNWNYTNIPPFRGPFVYNPDKAQEIHARYGNDKFTPSAFRWHMSAVGYENDFPTVLNGGWHFTMMGGVKSIQHKLQSNAHTGCNEKQFTSEEHISKCLEDGSHLFDNYNYITTGATLMKRDLSFLPEYVQTNIEKYRSYVRP